MSTFDAYQRQAETTAKYPRDKGIEYTALGLCGEAGEVAEKVKKAIRGDHDWDATKLQEVKGELGDVLWYLAMLATELGFSLDDVAESNLDKLFDRNQRGVIKGDGDAR